MNHFQRVYLLVTKIPYGNVTTYKQLAQWEGSITPRQAGYAMANCPKTYLDCALPWHRVINSQGKISDRSYNSDAKKNQAYLLKQEGIHCINNKIDLSSYLWTGPDAAWMAENGYYYDFL